MKNYWSLIQASFIFGLAVVLGATMALAQTQPETLSLSIGEIRDLSVRFAITNFASGNPEIVRVQRVGPQKVSVTGLKMGRTDLKVVGEADQTETFKIMVGTSVDSVLAEVRQILEALPVEASVNSSRTRVLLQGTITKPEDWAFLKKTVLPAYGDQVQSMVRFKVQDDLLLKLEKELKAARFQVALEGSPVSTPGTLSLHSVDNNVVINGVVSSRGELEAINQVVAFNPWLKIRRDDKDADDACYAVLHVTVAPVMLEVDVSFLGVTDGEVTTLGANLLKNGLAVVSGAASIGRDLLKGGSKSGNMTVNGSMGDTIQAITGGPGTGPGRFIQQAHLTFRNDAAEWKTLHDGGTIRLPVSGGLSGSFGVTPIDYGLILKVKGGLADGQNVALDINAEFSIPVPNGQTAAGPIYDTQGSKLESSILCPTGMTIIMGGAKELIESVNLVSATPVLGNIPVLKFLFSQKNHVRKDRQILILVSPQIARAPFAAAPLVEQTIDTTNKATKPISIQILK